MQKFISYTLAIITLLIIGFGLMQQVHAEEYEEPMQQEEQQEQSPSIDTSSYVQVADPALYAKLDTLQESVDKLVEALTPSEDAEADTEAPVEEQPTPDYTAQLSGISAQLADLAQQATAETANPAGFEKNFQVYTTEETLGLVAVLMLTFIVFFSLVKNFIL